MIKRNSIRRNGLTTRELLWVDLFTKYLTYFLIITFSFAVKIIVLTHKHVMLFICTMIFSKNLNICQIKIFFFNFRDVLFWIKIQNAALIKYETFPCYNLSFLGIFYIHAQRTCFSILRKYLFVKRKRACILIAIQK